MGHNFGMPEKIKIPSGPMSVVRTLNDNNYEAYIVGGCVRDSILGIVPKDWDITTNAKPEDIKRLFIKTIDTGIQHGTVTVVLEGENFEVTTYRQDGRYLDNRRPESVLFTAHIEDDLSRRDFTSNAVAYHPSTGFVDPFKGIADIRNSIIRCVGDADKRFQEDALRMLRALRFSAQLGFEIDLQILKAIQSNSNLIKSISQERIREELTKLLLSDSPEKFSILNETGLLDYILPELKPCFDTAQNNPYHIYNVAQHILKAVSSIRMTPVLRWTMLLHDSGKPGTKTTDENKIDHFYGHPEKSFQIAQKVMHRLKFDRKTIDKVCRLVRFHDRQIEPACNAVKRAIASVGDDIFPDLLEVKAADCKAQNPVFLDDRLKKIRTIRSMYESIKSENQCFSLKTLAINGNDLKKEGFKEGKEIGKVLQSLLEAVIDNPGLNTAEKLLDLAGKIRSNQ